MTITYKHQRPLGSLHDYVTARPCLGNQGPYLHRTDVVRAFPDHDGHITAGDSDKLLYQRIVGHQTFVQTGQNVTFETTGSSSKNTQSAIGGSNDIQDIYLGEAVLGARIRLQASNTMVCLAS
jgi:hypothetical protein